MADSTKRGPRYGTPNFEYITKMGATSPDDDGPVYMVNLMKYREVASYADGNPGGRSGREADDAYTPSAILRDIGAQIVFAGDVERQLLGSPVWDRIGIVKYPSRASFLQMQRRSDFKEKHVHKDAGMEQTIVMACLPQPTPDIPSAGATKLTAGDGPFVMLHVMRFAPGGESMLAEYEKAVGSVGLPLGVRPVANLTVEGTVIGDGRRWDQVRFNRFPSHQAFEDLIQNPVHQAAQPARSRALADTFAIMVTPVIDRLKASISGEADGR